MTKVSHRVLFFLLLILTLAGPLGVGRLVSIGWRTGAADQSKDNQGQKKPPHGVHPTKAAGGFPPAREIKDWQELVLLGVLGGFSGLGRGRLLGFFPTTNNGQGECRNEQSSNELLHL